MSLQCDLPGVSSKIRRDAQRVADEGFIDFIEASAKDNHKVESIFEKAVSLVSDILHTDFVLVFITNYNMCGY